jgi:ABC-type amino acid transport system permease subunit
MGDRKRLTYTEALHISWSLLWRGAVISILSMVTGRALGMVIGLILAATGVEVRVAEIVAGVAAGCVALFLWVPLVVGWTLPRDFGSFRLELVRVGPNPAEQAAVATVPLP